MDRDDPRFTDEEIRRILARAADRHEQAARAGERPPGSLSLAQLKEVGAEAGIDPAHVEAAALELRRTAGAAVPAGAPGGLWHPRAHRRVEGASLDAPWEAVVRALREAYGVNGVATDFGASREWCAPGQAGGGSVQARAEREGDGVSLTLTEDLGQLRTAPAWVGGGIAAFSILLVVLFLVGGEAAMLGAALWLVGVGGVIAAGGSVAGRLYAHARGRKLEAAADRAELALRGGGPATGRGAGGS